MTEFHSNRASLDPVGINDVRRFNYTHGGFYGSINIKSLTTEIIEADGTLPFGDGSAPYGFSELHNFKIGSEYFTRNPTNISVLFENGSALGEYLSGGHFFSEVSWFMDLNGKKHKTPLPYQNYIYDVAQTDSYNNVQTSEKDGVTKYRKIPCRMFHDQPVFNRKLQKIVVSENFSENFSNIEYDANADYTYILNPWVTYTARTYYSNKIDYMVWPEEMYYQKSGLKYIIYNAVDGDYKDASTPAGGFGSFWGTTGSLQLLFIEHSIPSTIPGGPPMIIRLPFYVTQPPALTIKNFGPRHWWYHKPVRNLGYPSSIGNNFINMGTSMVIDNYDYWPWLRVLKNPEQYYYLPDLYKKVHDRDFWSNDPINILLNYDSALSDGQGQDTAEDYFARLESTDSAPNNFGQPNIENSKLKLIHPGESITDTASKLLVANKSISCSNYFSSEFDGIYYQTFMEQITDSPYIPDIYLQAGDHGHGYFNFETGTTLDYYIRKINSQYRLYKKGDSKIKAFNRLGSVETLGNTPFGNGHTARLKIDSGKIYYLLGISTNSNQESFDQCFWNIELTPGRKTILYFKYIDVGENGLVIYINDSEVFKSSLTQDEKGLFQYKSFSFIPVEARNKISLATKISNGEIGAIVTFIECQQEEELIQIFTDKEKALDRWRDFHYKLGNYTYNPSSYVQQSSPGLQSTLQTAWGDDEIGNPKVDFIPMISNSLKERSGLQIKLSLYSVFTSGENRFEVTGDLYFNIFFKNFINADIEGSGTRISSKAKLLRPGRPMLSCKNHVNFDSGEQINIPYVLYDKNKNTKSTKLTVFVRSQEIVFEESISWWLWVKNDIDYDNILPSWKIEFSNDFENWEPIQDENHCYLQFIDGKKYRINSLGMVPLPQDFYEFNLYGVINHENMNFVVESGSPYFPAASTHNHYYYRISYVVDSDSGPLYKGTVLCSKISHYVAINQSNPNEVVFYADEFDSDIVLNEDNSINFSEKYLLPSTWPDSEGNELYFIKKYFDDEYPNSQGRTLPRSIYFFAGGQALQYYYDQFDLDYEDGFNIAIESVQPRGMNVDSVEKSNESNEFEEANIQPVDKKLTRDSWVMIHNLRVKGAKKTGALSEYNSYPYDNYVGREDGEKFYAGESLNGPFSTKSKSLLSTLRFEAFRRSFVEKGSPSIRGDIQLKIKWKLSMGSFLPYTQTFSANSKDPVRTITDNSTPPANGEDGNGWTDVQSDLVYNDDTGEYGRMPIKEGELYEGFKSDRISWDGYMNYIIGTRQNDGTYSWSSPQKGSKPRCDSERRLVWKYLGREYYETFSIPKKQKVASWDGSDHERAWKEFGSPAGSYSNVDFVVVFRKNSKEFSRIPEDLAADEGAVISQTNTRYSFAIKPIGSSFWRDAIDTSRWDTHNELDWVYRFNNKVEEEATDREIVWDWNGWTEKIPSIGSPTDKIYMSIGIFRSGAALPITEREGPYGNVVPRDFYDSKLETILHENEIYYEAMQPRHKLKEGGDYSNVTISDQHYVYRTKEVGHIYWLDPVLFAEGVQREGADAAIGSTSSGSIHGVTFPHLYLPRERLRGLKLNYHYFLDLEEEDKIQLEMAREYWESIITTDMEIDVHIKLMPQASTGGTLASAAPTDFIQSNFNAFNGEHPQITKIDINLDPFDIYDGSARQIIPTNGNPGILNGVTQLCAIMIHELWHGFGAGPSWNAYRILGSRWGAFSIYSDIVKSGLFGAEYIGSKALQKYKEIIGTAKYAKYIQNNEILTDSIQSLKNRGVLGSFNTTAVPVQGYGLEIEVDSGKKGGHFAEYARKAGNNIRPVFTEMISAIYDVKESPMTSVGIGMLEDLGYSVDYNAVAKDGVKLIKTSFKNTIADPIIIYTGKEYFTYRYYKILSAEFRNSVTLQEYLTNQAYGVQERSSYLTEGYDTKRICTSCGHYHSDINLNEETDNSIDIK
jgi:hypothetical protein